MSTATLATLSAVAVGLMSGLYWAFTVAVMPGLRDIDDAAFVTAMQAINRRIQNVWFAPVFIASVLLPVVTAVMLLARDHDGDARRWGIAGAGLALLPFGITVAGNIPLNTALDRVDVSSDPAAVRRAFEAPWNRRNLLRTVLSTAALVALVRMVALME